MHSRIGSGESFVAIVQYKCYNQRMQNKEDAAVNFDDLVKEICNILNIAQPKIVCDSSKLIGDTMMAMCSPSGDIIYIRDGAVLTPTLVLAVSHELRHVWQIQTNPEFWLADYEPSSDIDAESYNLQPAEIDAHAFSVLILGSFGLRPDFPSFSETLNNAIFLRADEIEKELTR